MKQTQFNCPVETTLSLIGGKYKPLILWHLVDRPLHYMEQNPFVLLFTVQFCMDMDRKTHSFRPFHRYKRI